MADIVTIAKIAVIIADVIMMLAFIFLPRREEMSEYKYVPDGDSCYWKEDKCNGEPCIVDCYRCPIGAEIEEEMAAEYEKDESEEDT